MSKQPKLTAIREVTRFNQGMRLRDYLHPSYGPYPHLCLILQDDSAQFTVAAWHCLRSKAVMVWEERSNIYHQGVMQTYRWFQRGEADHKKWHCNLNKSTCIDVKVEPTLILRGLVFCSAMAYRTY